MPRRKIPSASFGKGPTNSGENRPLADDQNIIDSSTFIAQIHPTPLSNIPPLQLVRWSGGGLYLRSSLRSHPIPTLTYLLLVPLPLSFSFALLPLAPFIKRTATQRRSRHRRRMSSRSQKSPPTTSSPQTKAVGQARTPPPLPLQRPRLLVLEVNMRPTPDDAETDAGVPSPTDFPRAFHRWTQVLCKNRFTTRATGTGMRGRLPPVRRCHLHILMESIRAPTITSCPRRFFSP